MRNEKDGREEIEEEEDDLPRKRSRKSTRRRQEPTIAKFQIWFDFEKSLVTADYEAPEGFTAEDLEDFVYEQLRGFKLYKKRASENNRKSSRKGGRRYDRDYD